MLTLRPTIAGIRFPFCLMNAAGALSTSREELLALAYSEAGAVVTKSITSESFLDPGANCGIENPGVAYYVELLPELRRAGKPIITSVAGLTIDEFVVTAQTLAAAGADLLEINLNEPHVHEHLAPFASAENLRKIVTPLQQAVRTPLVVKLPPQVPLALSLVAAVLCDAGIPAAVCHNATTNGQPSQAQTMLAASQGKLDVIGVGGVSHGVEALAVLHSGIKAVQIASAVVKEGVSAFARIKRELADTLEARV
ncbi:MAG: dihydroorotate dehydrogenase [Candidatus Binatia bacterium]